MNGVSAIHFERSYVTLVLALAGCGVLAIVIAAVSIARMHAASLQADVEKTRIAGAFYEANGLKILTVAIIVFALVGLAVLGLAKGSEVVGTISAIGGYVLGSLGKGGAAPKPPDDTAGKGE